MGNRIIYKYEFSGNYLDVPAGRPVLVAQQWPSATLPTLWVEHELGTGGILDRYIVVGTGHELNGPMAGFQHVGSAICGPYVWHVYKGLKP